MGVEDHRRRAPGSVRAAVLTVSDSRSPETDRSGLLIRELLLGKGHQVVDQEIVRDEPETLREKLRDWTASDRMDAILITGGTGLAPRDSTFEILESILEKRIDGFGELFRSLSFQEIGPAAMLSRAAAGVASGKVLMAMPGSEAAVRLAMERLILPELPHLVWLVTGSMDPTGHSSNPGGR